MKKLWVENIANAAIVYQEYAPNENFVDMSADIHEWDKAVNIMDWSRRRDMINPLFYAEAGSQLQNFASLSYAKKIIACSYFLVPYNIRESIVGEVKDSDNGEFLLNQTRKSRIDCIQAMRKYTWNNYVRKSLMTLETSQQMYKDISSANKIEDFQESNAFDFKNWVFGLAPYEGVFAGTNYYSVELQNGLINIYNGDY